MAFPAKSTPSPYTTRRRILVVEDQADAAATLALLLRLHGHEVNVALDGTAALQALQTLTADVVFIDIGLPDMDGREVARRIRQSDQNGALLIAVTGYGAAEDCHRSAEAGFNHHLVKPVTITVINKILETIQ